MKKRTRRSESKFPALDPKLNLKTRADLVDMDYVDQLNQSEKQWLNDFMNEYTNADFKTNINQGRKRIHRKKRSESEKNGQLRKLLTDILVEVKQYQGMLNIEFVGIKSTLNQMIKVIHTNLNNHLENLQSRTNTKYQQIDAKLESSGVNTNSKTRIKKIISKCNRDLKGEIDEQFTQFRKIYKKQIATVKERTNPSGLKKLCQREIVALRKQVEDELIFIEDYYKKESESANNSRNACILTRSHAQGKTKSIDIIPEGYFGGQNPEDEMIARLDLAKELNQTNNDTTDGSDEN